MGEERITLAGLRKLLSNHTTLSEKVCGEFVDALFQSIIEGLRTDKSVKINGLGTFKVQWNEPRKSINVQTGEPIVIEGYNKVIFVPDSILKERINEPFAHLEPIVIDENQQQEKGEIDPMEKLGEQVEEIKDILAELDAITDNEEQSKEEPTPTEEATPCEEEKEKEAVTEVPAKEEEPIKEEKPTQKHKEKPFQPWKVAGITILCFCVFLVGCYFFLQHKITAWADSLLNKQATTTEVVQSVDDSSDNDAILVDSLSIDSEKDSLSMQEEGLIENKSTSKEQPIVHKERTYTDFITTETLTEGSRLTWLSRKYYGAPDFWVYIYEANKSVLPNPNLIPIGTRIRIPRLPKELIDVNNEESMKQARQLHDSILGKS